MTTFSRRPDQNDDFLVEKASKCQLFCRDRIKMTTFSWKKRQNVSTRSMAENREKLYFMFFALCMSFVLAATAPRPGVQQVSGRPQVRRARLEARQQLRRELLCAAGDAHERVEELHLRAHGGTEGPRNGGPLLRMGIRERYRTLWTHF